MGITHVLFCGFEKIYTCLKRREFSYTEGEEPKVENPFTKRKRYLVEKKSDNLIFVNLILLMFFSKNIIFILFIYMYLIKEMIIIIF